MVPELEGSSPYSEEPVTSPCPEPPESNAHPTANLVQHYICIVTCAYNR
jgi:hypothetical protein